MLNMMRVLTRPSHDAKITKFVGQLDVLQRKVPQRISGRQAFLSKVNARLQASPAGSPTHKNKLRLKVFKHHGKAWQGMHHTS